jgi:hypothetical protein
MSPLSEEDGRPNIVKPRPINKATIKAMGTNFANQATMPTGTENSVTTANFRDTGGILEEDEGKQSLSQFIRKRFLAKSGCH